MILPNLLDVRTAYHEAGHAVAIHLYGGTAVDVSIEPGEGSNGRCWIEATPPVAIRAALAGMAAEQILGCADQRTLPGARTDLLVALSALDTVRCRLSFEASDGDVLDHELEAVLCLLRTERRLLDALAAALVEHRRLDAQAVAALLERVT